jgi:formyl-CoA transferase
MKCDDRQDGATELRPPTTGAAGPLASVRVVELATMIAGPLTGMLLAQMGADVIKVESPEGGDPFRSFSSDGYGPQIVAFNRGKRSIVLNLRAPQDRFFFEKLLSTTDVLIDNYRPGTLERLGLGGEYLRERFPELIHCSVTGFGASGPYAARPAYDGVAQSLSGMLSLTLDMSDPQIGGPTISDNVTAYTAALAITGALHERAACRRSRRIEVSMLDATIAFMPDAFSKYAMEGVIAGPLSRVAASQTFTLICADQKLLTIHLSAPAKFWTGLLLAIDAPELASDPRFDSRPKRVEHYAALRIALAQRFACRDRAELLLRLTMHDVPHAPVLSLDEVIDDPQVRATGIFGVHDNPQGVSVPSINSPWLFDGERTAGVRRAPLLGEHQRELAQEINQGKSNR